jgi:hypothetical protein
MRSGADLPRPNEELVRFYLGSGEDERHRRIGDIWAWDDKRLEDVHDYIQWLFPLREPSRFNSQAPLLDDATVAVMRTTPAIRQALHRSFLRMLAFYGLEYREEAARAVVHRSADFAARRQWMRPADHNQLRMTRILACLSILGLNRQAHAFLACLEELQAENPAVISAVTLGYWRRAVHVA